MAVGFARDGAEQQEVEAVVQAAVLHARSQFNSSNPSLPRCMECNSLIPEARQLAVKGCSLCVKCQENVDSIYRRKPRNCWHRSMN